MRPSLIALTALVLLVPSLAAGCTGPLFDNVSQVGDAAKALVDGSNYPKMVIEIDHPQGYGPDSPALSILKSALVEISGRDASDISIITEASIPSEPDKRYSFAEVRALEDAHRSRHTSGDTVVLYFVYVAGHSDQDSNDGSVLGAAYRGTSLVMFKGNINAASRGSGVLDTRPPVRCIERAVAVHEFGHAAGLVNLGTPMQTPHEDGSHKGHSSNKNSVMWWAVEDGRSIVDLFTGSCNDIPFEFDANDKADLKALRNS